MKFVMKCVNIISSRQALYSISFVYVYTRIYKAMKSTFYFSSFVYVRMNFHVSRRNILNAKKQDDGKKCFASIITKEGSNRTLTIQNDLPPGTKHFFSENVLSCHRQHSKRTVAPYFRISVVYSCFFLAPKKLL